MTANDRPSLHQPDPEAWGAELRDADELDALRADAAWQERDRARRVAFATSSPSDRSVMFDGLHSRTRLEDGPSAQPASHYVFTLVAAPRGVHAWLCRIGVHAWELRRRWTAPDGHSGMNQRRCAVCRRWETR